MRTKHLLYTMALAGIFAACTQDEFETVNGADALAGRKSIGKVTFTEAPSTRWAVENWNTIAPEAGDAFSLMLVDNPRTGLDGQHLYPIDNYELINKVQTNYIFKNNGNDKWDSEAELVEGNYLYVAPAQEGKLDRNTVEITLPTEQNLSLGEDGKIDPLSAIKEFVSKKYPFYIGHRFLSEGGSISLPNMQSIFAYPEITITNSDAFRDQTAIVTKVIIKQEVSDDAFVINAPLNAENAARLLTNEFFADREKTETSKDKVVIGDWAGHANQYFGVDEEVKQEWKNDFVNKEKIAEDATFEARDLNGRTLGTYLYNNGLKGTTSDLLGTPTSKSQYIVINMPGEGIALKYGESIKFNAIIPADHYTMTTTEGKDPERLGLTLYAVLDNNEAYKKVVDAKNSQVDMYPGKRYPNQDYTGLEVKDGKGLYFTVDICNGKTDGVGKYVMIPASEIGGVGTINSTDALVAAIKAHTSTENLNLTVEGRNVVYNKEVNDAVANTNCQNVNIQGHIKVQAEAGTTLTINSRVNIEDAVIEKGGKIVANENSLKEVLVSRDAELELANVEDASVSQAVIYNTGILTLSTADFVRVDNYGKLNVKADLADKFVSTNANNKKDINILYAACGEGGEIISPSINLKPEVRIMAGGRYAISDALNYEITVDKKSSDKNAGELVLNGRTQIVKNEVYFGSKKVTKEGNIINNGKISGGDKVLVVYPGLEMTIEKDGVVEPQVMIRGASHTLSDLLDDGPVAVADYVPAAVVHNNGTMNAVKVDGKLIMGAGSRVEGNVTAANDGNTDGEIDNTAKGILAGRVPEKVTVFAEFKSLDLRTEESGKTERANIKVYADKYQVSVIRLTGALNMSDENRSLKKEHCGNVTLEFAQGSSLNIGYAKLTSDLPITVTGKNIEWKGSTVEGSTFDLTAGAELTKGEYLTVEKGEYTVAKGNVWFRNCKVVDALGSATPEE
ncbi:MAG TPA: hypothetical protein H9824_04775 [Candidatus Bacteroides pullicola]|uniref:Uncharacterized protein n=1 Tax=Candidatus Bacteroides pullicola TaxID=2838475 RepID=A0A9D1ZHG8_9BACE|nr:hypothetical protein [Candidatus Bacteroides pullicola]